MKKRVILSAGGTGGHLFPAQSLADDLANWEILFVAGGLKDNKYFDREKFTFEEVSCATFAFSKPLHIPQACWKIYKGMRQSQKILKSFEPDLVVGFGSFFTVPILLAAMIEKIPFVLHEQNAIFGKVNRFFSRFAHTIATTFPNHAGYRVKNKSLKRSVEVLFPLRPKTNSAHEENWKYFGLSRSKPVLLVFGGSQGAARINSLFLAAVEQIRSVQVIHLTGNDERAQEARRKYHELGLNACVKPFESSMDRAMQIADFAITRAGAATVAELIEYELPSLLIPYPFATDNHQEANGAHFVAHVKGGEMYKENELHPSGLAQILSEVIPKRNELKKNITLYKQNRQTQTLAALIEGIIT